MSEIDELALIAHEERQFAERTERIRRLGKPPIHGKTYVPTIEKRFEWMHDFFERHDFENVVSQADEILAMNPTGQQRDEALRLRTHAESAARVFGDSLIKPPPVEPTWR
jgi:hypothetical protein